MSSWEKDRSWAHPGSRGLESCFSLLVGQRGIDLAPLLLQIGLCVVRLSGRVIHRIAGLRLRDLRVLLSLVT